MDLFCFASRNTRNIELGIENKLWAVATLTNEQSMKARVTKAKKYLHPGAYGILYCNPTQSFTTPFIVRSNADPEEVVTNVWPEPWCLPFRIEPLGDLSKQTSSEQATKHWPVVQRRMARNQGRGGISAAMNITGTTVFVPVSITDKDWKIILEDLAT